MKKRQHNGARVFNPCTFDSHGLKTRTPFSVAERAFINALEAPVPAELRAAVQHAARREISARAFRRRVAWCLSPVAVAAVILIMLGLLHAPDAVSAQPFTAQHHARTLVSLAAGGDIYHEEADVNSLARDLLSLQGFAGE